ncbi:MAG: S6 family peptidase, partial [Moraxella sp.]|nr:S6 family peptidase [Moraxella sp.]
MKKLNPFAKTVLAASIALIITTPTHASIVRGDIDYQNFRDFAENKGQFGLDATNVEIADKNGQVVGRVLEDIPMIDFAVTSRGNGVATLVDTQYIASVQHNRGYQGVQFGDHSNANPDSHHYDYQITNRHNAAPGTEISNWHRDDYHTPRLHKLVTEVAPIPASDETHISGFTDKEKYTAFVRAGSGTQEVVDQKGDAARRLSGAYQYMTGGEMLGSPSVYNQANIPGNTPDTILRFGGPNALFDEVLGSSQRSGDSGSGVFAYDSKAGRWVYVASGQSGSPSNIFVISHLGLLDKNKQLSIAGDVIANGQTLAWTPNGNTSTLSTNGQTLLSVGLADEGLAEREGINNGHWFRPRQDHGKTFTVMGENNLIQLTDNINQGSGAIYFKGDTTVEGVKAGTTWLGAGVSIDKDKTVTWRVHNPDKDRLSKIGEGTLLVQGTGLNLGSISVGDGKVILDQQADSAGNKQAFNEVGIVSGRGTVVLNSKDQVNPDNIYFGFRGGRLDVNGNDLSFNRIQNADSGARIVNHNTHQAATITVGKQPTLPTLTAADIDWVTGRSRLGNIHMNVYPDGYVDYYVLRDGGTLNHFLPSKGQSNNAWELLSSNNKEEAERIYLARENAKRTPTANKDAFSGFLGETDGDKPNGTLNFVYNPIPSDDVYLLNGGTNLNGHLTANNGHLILSGRPTPHAYDFIEKKEVIREGDWQNRSFKATTFKVNQDGKITIGRNVSQVIGDFVATGNGQIQAGFTQNKSDVCLRSDRTGAVTCDTPTLSDKDLASWERTLIAGRVNLADQSSFTVGSKGHFVGTMASTDDSTAVLDKDAIWTMTGESNVNRLAVDNATINLNANFDQGQSTQYNRLNIGELSGQGTFNYLTDIGQLVSDKVVVGIASGDFKLNVKNTGAEPTHNDRLILLTAEQERDFKVALANPDERVDIGAYRYELIKGEQVYQLYSPKIEQEFLERERLEKERLEAEKRAEAERLERERIEAERQAELARLEAARLEAERLEAERQAELARQEAERQAELARQEAARLEAEHQAELARQEAERLEAARLEAERQAELARQEAARLEAERLETERQAELAKQQA